MEGLKTLSAFKSDGLSWGDIKELLNDATQEQLEDKAIIWQIDNDKAKINGHVIYTLSVAAEDHINWSGDGHAPVSLFDLDDLEGQLITLKKGTLIASI